MRKILLWYWCKGWFQPTPLERILLLHLHQKTMEEAESIFTYYKILKNWKIRCIYKRLVHFGLLEVQQKNNKTILCLTESAWSLLETSKYLLYLDDLKLCDNPQQIQRLKDKQPACNEYDIAKQVILSRLKKHKKRKNWYEYRNDLVMLSSNAMQHFLYIDMFIPLFQVCWFDLNGSVLNNFFKDKLIDGIISHLDYAFQKAGIPPAIIYDYCKNAVDTLPKEIRQFGCDAEMLWKKICKISDWV